MSDDSQSGHEGDPQPSPDRSGGMARLLKIGLVIFALIVGGIVVAAIVAGDQADLPFDYEGFD